MCSNRPHGKDEHLLSDWRSKQLKNQIKDGHISCPFESWSCPYISYIFLIRFQWRTRPWVIAINFSFMHHCLSGVCPPSLTELGSNQLLADRAQVSRMVSAHTRSNFTQLVWYLTTVTDRLWLSLPVSIWSHQHRRRRRTFAWLLGKSGFTDVPVLPSVAFTSWRNVHWTGDGVEGSSRSWLCHLLLSPCLSCFQGLLCFRKNLVIRHRTICVFYRPDREAPQDFFFSAQRAPLSPRFILMLSVG